MQHRKRPLAVLYIELECDRPMKRFKYDHAGGLNVALTLPVQQEQELGPFWVTTGCCGSLERTQAAEADCPSLGSWGGVGHQHSASLSLSLMMQQTLSGSQSAGDDEETSDTATSSGSDASESDQHQQQQCISLHKPRTAAAGEEDSITSSQPVPPASVAFSFGSRPYLTPDLTAVHCWDVLHDVLAAV